MYQNLTKLAHSLGQGLSRRGWKLVTAESCTGGWLAKVITDIPGSSLWLERGFVTYSNEAKQELLGVTLEVISNYGAVSNAVVTQMAQGALTHSHANLAVAISGIAGPDGGTTDKPVGTVWFAWALSTPTIPMIYTSHKLFVGDRDAVRCQAVQYALEGLIETLTR